MKLAKRLLVMARPYWGVMTATVLALIGAAVMGLVTPAVVRRLTATLEDPAGVDLGTLLIFAGVLIGAYVIRGVCKFLSQYLAHVAAWNFVGDMIAKVYAKLQTLSMRFYGSRQTGEIMSRASNDTRILEVLIAHAVPDLISNVLIIIGVAVMLFVINPPLAALTLIPVPLVLVASWKFSGKVRPMFRRNQVVMGELGGLLQDNISGMKEIQAFGKEPYEDDRMRRFSKYYSSVNIRANFVNAIFNPIIEFLTSIGTVIVVLGGGLLVLGNKMPV
ncbi:MAG: ABC transporter transmembrane domain-containing protein, partial [Acutalibacteraceae bacterium]